MFFFQPVLALLGFAVLAAGYSIPGSYERLYFYYAYRMDHIASANPIIATGCVPAKGKLCDLDEFIKFISQDGSKITSSVAAVTHPEVEATAKKIVDEGLTGIINVNKVVQDAKGNYATLFKKIGEKFVGKLKEETLQGIKKEFLEDFKTSRMKGYEALHAVLRERMRAAVDSFKPFAEEATPFVVKTKLHGDIPVFDLPETAEANPHIPKKTIKQAYLDHTAGGHTENLETLANHNNRAEKLLKIPSCADKRRRVARRGALCAIGILKDDVLFPRLGGAAKLAEEVSEAEFDRLASKKGFKAIANKKWGEMSLPEVRKKLKYEKLTAESPKISVGKGGFKAPSVGVVDVGFWVYGVVRAWALDVTSLDRAAAVTSILPVIGCAVQAFADGEKNAFDTLDTALCILGDGLMFTAAAPLGIVLHVVRAIMSFFKPPPLPEPKTLLASRDAVWNRFLKDDIYSYIYSHPDYSTVTGRRKNETEAFREKLNSSFAIEGLAVLSHGAQTIGATVASARDSLDEASTTPEDKAKIEQGIVDVTAQFEAAADKEIIRRQRELLISLPGQLKEKHNTLLGPVADKLNEDFFEQATSEEMFKKYRKKTPTAPGGPVLDNKDELCKTLHAIGDALYDNPPALPRYFDLAYILGQSQGLAPLSEETLSVQGFLRDRVTNMSEASIQLYTLHHTLQVAKVLSREIAEDDISTLLPNSDDQGVVRDLQTFIAIKYGRVTDASKMWLAKEQYPGGAVNFMWAPDDIKAAGIIVSPDVPPETPLLTGPTSIFLTTGLSEAIVASLKDQEQALSERAENSELIRMLMEQAKKIQEILSNRESAQSALTEAQKRKSDADAELLADPQAAAADKVVTKRTLRRAASAYSCL